MVRFSAAELCVGLSAILAAALPGCERSGVGSGDAPWFEEIGAQKKLDFVHDPGKLGGYFMPEIIGSGAALFDFDNDGRLDIYLIQNSGAAEDRPSGAPGKGGGEAAPGAANRLFRQKENGEFEDVSRGSGLEVAGRGMGAAAGDATNDGWVDLLLTEYGRTRFFINNGNGTFTDATRESGIDNPVWGASACWFDFDRDGWLDLAIANYVVYSATRPCSDQGGKRDYCGPAPFAGTVTRLYRNLGAAGGVRSGGGGRSARFEDVTVRSGLAQSPGPGLGVIAADFDGDRWQDLLVANDGKPNHLWMNQRDGAFREEAVVRGVAYNGMGQALANMGIALGDVDCNGLFDVYITHLADEQHVYYSQESAGQFVDRTAAAGLVQPLWRGTGFGAVFGDFDLDGDLDLAQVNGRVKFISGPSEPGRPFLDVYMERSQLFSSDGKGRFTDRSPGDPAFCERRVARCLAIGDIDNDGAADLLVTAVGERARLFRNVAPRRGRWLLARAIDPGAGGRDAYGAAITAIAGGRRWTVLVTASQSYLASSDPRAHFGLGDIARIESLEVAWPDGSREKFPGVQADRLIVLRKGEGEKL